MEDAGNEDASTLLPVCGRFPARNKSISSSKPVLLGKQWAIGSGHPLIRKGRTSGHPAGIN
jgi:hypothetical protein